MSSSRANIHHYFYVLALLLSVPNLCWNRLDMVKSSMWPKHELLLLQLAQSSGTGQHQSNLFRQVLLGKIIKDLVAWVNTTATAIYVQYCSLLRPAFVLLLQIHSTILLFNSVEVCCLHQNRDLVYSFLLARHKDIYFCCTLWIEQRPGSHVYLVFCQWYVALSQLFSLLVSMFCQERRRIIHICISFCWKIYQEA